MSLADLTKLAESVIVEEQLQGHIDATVDTSKADYAIVSACLPSLLRIGLSVLLRLKTMLYCQCPQTPHQVRALCAVLIKRHAALWGEGGAERTGVYDCRTLWCACLRLNVW